MKEMNSESSYYSISSKKTTAGKLQAGDVFLFRRNIWIVVNRSEGGRFVRTLVGEYHRSKVISADVKVKKVISIKKPVHLKNSV